MNDLKQIFDSSNYFSGNVDSTTSIDYRFGEVDKLFKRENDDRKCKN